MSSFPFTYLHDEELNMAGPPTLQLSEANTSAGTKTVITAVNFAGGTGGDLPSNTNQITQNYPIPTNQNSWEKWIQLQVINPAPNALSNFSIYFSSTAPVDGAGASNTLKTFFGIVAKASFATPTNAVSTVATTLCSTVTSPPGTPFTAPANTANAFSDFFVLQLQVLATAAGGTVVFPAAFGTYAYVYS